jgi:hypothetical protein
MSSDESFLGGMIVGRGNGITGGDYYGGGLGLTITSAIGDALDKTPVKPVVELHRNLGMYAISLGNGFVGVLMVLVMMYMALNIILPFFFKRKSKFSNDTYQNRYRGAIRSDGYGEEDRWGIAGRNMPRYSGMEDEGFDGGADDEGFDGGADDEGFDGGADDEGFDGGADDEGFDGGADDEGFDGGGTLEYFDVDGVRKNAFSNGREPPYFSDVSDYVSVGQKRQQAAVRALAVINNDRRRRRMITQGKDPERALPWGPFWDQYQVANPQDSFFGGEEEGMEDSNEGFSVPVPY